MRGRFFLLVIVSCFIWSCEDPTNLAVSKVFSSNKLQTVYSDTFSVVTSVVQLDSVLTSGTGTILLGRYKDQQLGTMAASSYFQVGYRGQFLMDNRFVFDSVVLVLPYNHVFVGDTSKAVTVNLYRLIKKMEIRTLPSANDYKISAFAGSGFYNTSTVARSSSPIISKSVKFYPHKDTLCIRLPDAFGKKWFSLSQSGSDSAQTYFGDVNKFVDYYFNGFNLDVDSGTDACVVGFSTDKLKLRFYFKKYSGDFYKETHYDFLVYAGGKQFNHIDFDRLSTPYLSSLKKMEPLSTLKTGNLGLVQYGTGLVTRLDFPSVKNFFSINNGVILNAAYLEIYPTRGSYTKDFLVPNTLQLFKTDISNLPLATVSGGVAQIHYDFEFGSNTVYRYQFFPYLFEEIKSSANYITPLIIGPAGNQGSSLQRLYFGDRFFPETKVKLKLYYSYALN